ncbi:MAG: hypothetical protein R2878_03075 [Thermoleophilia bacterium]
MFVQFCEGYSLCLALLAPRADDLPSNAQGFKELEFMMARATGRVRHPEEEVYRLREHGASRNF